LEPSDDTLSCHWEVVEEGTQFPYGGQGEKKPPVHSGCIEAANRQAITWTAPLRSGPYRIFVSVYDSHGHFACANVAFFVEE